MVVQPEAPGFAPGLGMKKPSGRSSFGWQTNSRKTTAPNFSLGHSTRDGSSKVFISARHLAVDKRCTAGPGPLYDVPSSLDKQAEAQKETAPQYSFPRTERLRSSEPWVPGPGEYVRPGSLGPQVDSSKMTNPTFRFGSTSRDKQARCFISSAHEQRNKGTAGAPPGAYDSTESLGRQCNSLRMSSPAFSMPRFDRLRNHNEKLSQSMPAVGSYETWGSLGKQSQSKVRTQPCYGFGSSSRDKEGRRFLSAGHTAKTNMGVYSPSHFNNQLPTNQTSLGRQGLSQRASSPMTKFGTARRLHSKENDTPGPGAYD